MAGRLTSRAGDQGRIIRPEVGRPVFEAEGKHKQPTIQTEARVKLQLLNILIIEYLSSNEMKHRPEHLNRFLHE